jgi:hypothetical protein
VNSTDLHGVIDTHVHTAPDAVARSIDDLSMARSARDAGYRAIVLKSHHFVTADRAALVNELVEGIDIYGGIALNPHACGGINPLAVEVAASVGGRVVWMPTFAAASHVSHRTRAAPGPLAALGAAGGPGIGVLDARGRPHGAVTEVLDVMAQYEMTLATGHLSAPEILALVPHARDRGVERAIVTHPEMDCVGLSHTAQRELASAGGVWFERVYVLTLPPFDGSLSAVREAVTVVGPESTILATDLGQVGNPLPVDGMAAYLSGLREEGIEQGDIDTMTRVNPALALGLEVSAN